MRLDLHTDEQFAAVENWFDLSGQGHLSGAWLVRAARRAGISLINLSDPSDELLLENLDRTPALVLVGAVSQSPDLWPQRQLFLPWAHYGVIYSTANVFPKFYEACVETTKEIGRLVMVEGVEHHAHDWARAFIDAKTPYLLMAPTGSMPADRLGAVIN